MSEIFQVASIPCAVLTKYLSMVTPGIGNSAIIEVMRCVKMDFDFDEKKITLTTRNSEMRTTVELSHPEIEFFQDKGILTAAVFPDVLRNTMKFGRGENIMINISDDGRRIRTECGSMVNEYGLPDAKDLPGEIEQSGDAVYFSCSDGAGMIARIKAAASIIDPAAPSRVTHGVYVHSKEREIRIVGVKGGYTMLYDTMPSEAMVNEFSGMIIPKDTVLAISGMFDGYKGELDMALGDRFGVIKGGSLAVVFCGIAGDYPNYRRAFPAKFRTDWKADMKEFQQLAESIAGTNRELIRFEIEDGACIASSEKGSAQTRNRIAVKDCRAREEFEFFLNFKNMDAMFKISGECEFMVAERVIVVRRGSAMAIHAKIANKSAEPDAAGKEAAK